MAEINHTSRAHALLSASGASRWLNCTPSARLEEKFQESGNSVYAEEGTLAHEFADLNLRFALGHITPKIHGLEIKKLRKHKLYSSEMEGEVEKYTDYVLELYNIAKQNCPGAILLIEEKLDFSHLVEGGFGTGDVTIIADKDLFVVDLKYGKGVRVDAVENSQLKLYGSGALRKFELQYDIDQVTMIIVQPRLDHVDSFTLTTESLVGWGERVVKPKAALAYKGEGEQVAGDWCRFCKVKGMCKALANKNLELAQLDFVDPYLLTDKQLIGIYGQLSMLTDWAKGVASYVLSEAVKGKQWDGYKVVEGRSNRTWKDEKAVQLLLENDHCFVTDAITTKTLKGVPDIEKLVGKKNFPGILGPYVIKPQGAPALVPESDKRPAMGSTESAQADFADPEEDKIKLF